MKKNNENVESDNLLSNSKSAVYQLQGHEKYERNNLPINYSLLNFTTKGHSERLLKMLYMDESGKLSEEIKLNMMYYFTYNVGYLVILLVFSLLFYNSGSMPADHLKIHLSVLVILLTSHLLFWVFVNRFGRFVKKIREIFLFIAMSQSFYLIFSDSLVIEKFSGEPSGKRLPMSLGMISGIVMARLVLFDYFPYVIIIGLINSLIFSVTNLGVNGYQSNNCLSEIAVITLFNLVQIVECYRSDYRIKQIFWRREKEEMENISLNYKNDSFIFSGINTEIEYLLSTCSVISSNLKKVSKVIIFKDIKKIIKESISGLEKIKNRIAHGLFENRSLDLRPEIDEEDRVFITENFMHIKTVNIHRTTTLMIERPSLNLKKLDFDEVDSILATVGKNWSFNIFFLYETTGKSISLVSRHLFLKWDLYTMLNIDEEHSGKYFESLERAYNENPYHNASHASDVLHSMIYFLLNSDLGKSLNLIDFFCVIVASLGHDVGHPALTNRYLVSSRDDLSIKYNDTSVLESMHCALTFTLGCQADCNVFLNFDKADWMTIRKLIIEMILETDMSKHFDVIARFKTRAILLSDLNISLIDDKSNILSMGLKCADISHSAKDLDLHLRWSKLVIEEFFNQGDLEKKNGLLVSMYCDRDTTDVPKVQTGFLKNICLPLFEIWVGYLNSEVLNSVVLAQVKNNITYWEDKRKNRTATVLVKIKEKDFENARRRISHL